MYLSILTEIGENLEEGWREEKSSPGPPRVVGCHPIQRYTRVIQGTGVPSLG